MSQDKRSGQPGDAAGEFERHEHRTDGAGILSSLDAGMTLLRETLYLHLHQELENVLGVDSMLTPVSEIKTRQQVKIEIELYQVAESAAVVAENGYVRSDGPWYLHWLADARLGQVMLEGHHYGRMVEYARRDPQQRRLMLTDVLVTVVPEARRAPLVLFRLFPMAVQIATAIAFDDGAYAARIRANQVECLPAIEDCSQCRGQVLHNGEQCAVCGNPLWKTTWLMLS